MVFNFDSFGGFPPPALAQPSGSPGSGLAAHGGLVGVGSSSGQSMVIEGSALAIYGYTSGTFLTTYGVTIGADATSNFYVANSDGSVMVLNPWTQVSTSFVTLPFVPAGIAIDSARGRIYFSDSANNQIQVYSTAGAWLQTIQ